MWSAFSWPGTSQAAASRPRRALSRARQNVIFGRLLRTNAASERESVSVTQGRDRNTVGLGGVVYISIDHGIDGTGGRTNPAGVSGAHQVNGQHAAPSSRRLSVGVQQTSRRCGAVGKRSYRPFLEFRRFDLLRWDATEAEGRPLAGISSQERAEAIELIMLNREGEIKRELDWATRDEDRMRVELALTRLMDTEASGWLFLGILSDLGEQYREEAKQRAQTWMRSADLRVRSRMILTIGWQMWTATRD